jgi:dihydroneopterin aldolase
MTLEHRIDFFQKMGMIPANTRKKDCRKVDKRHVSELIISDLRLWVHLGCGEEEKYHVQPISVTIQILLPTPPVGIKTDVLADTFCYLQAVETIKAVIKKESFNLIEHLTGRIYAAVHQNLAKEGYTEATLTVTVNKMSPPVPDIHGGVSFRYSEG